MNYTVNVTASKSQEGNVRGFATLVFGDSFKITNIAILENKEKNQLFVSMPRYKSNERDGQGSAVYKDVCNPITAEFREELYGTILSAYEQARQSEKGQSRVAVGEGAAPTFSVTVTPFEREGSNIRGLARVYLEDCFIINNVSILQGKDKMFVAMPSYKTNQKDEQGKAVYQDVSYPVTKEFRETLYAGIASQYEQAKDLAAAKQRSEISQGKTQTRGATPEQKQSTPFR